MAKKTKQAPLIAATKALIAVDREFQEGTDRVVAILGGAYLETLLESLLRAFLGDSDDAHRLLETSGPLGTHSSRLALASSIGLITEDIRRDLDNVARIRNAFAHKFEISAFDSDNLRDLCANLRQPRIQEDLARKTLQGGAAEAAVHAVRGMSSTPRGQFTTTIHGLMANLFRRTAFLKPMGHEWFMHDPDSADGPQRQ